MESQKKRKRLSHTAKKSFLFKNKNQTEDLVTEYSDFSEEYLDSVFKATLSAERKTFICTLTLQARELGLTAVDVKDFSDISYAPHFSSDVHVLLTDTNAVLCEKEELKCSKKCQEKDSSVQTFPKVKLLCHPANVTALSYANENLLLSGSVDGTVKVWDSNYDLVASFKDTMKSLSDIHASSKLDHFASSSFEGVKMEKGATLYGASLFVFDRKHPVASLLNHTSPTQCVRFHANGMYVATASRDGTIHLWSTHAPGTPVRTFREGGHDRRKCMEFSPDGKYLATTHRGTVNVWDLASGRLFRTLRPASDVVCFGDSGRRLATGTADGHLALWNVHSDCAEDSPPLERHPLGLPVLRIRCHGDVYACVCASQG